MTGFFSGIFDPYIFLVYCRYEYFMCQIYRIAVDYMVQIELMFSMEELHCKTIASTNRKRFHICRTETVKA